MAWVPTTDFEEEIVALQPDHNFIFGRLSEAAHGEFYPRPKVHLEYAASQQQQRKPDKDAQSHKLGVIAKVQRIAGTKPLGEQPTVDDWDSKDDVERETVAMMRHCGLGPSIEEPLDDLTTIATLPITEEVHLMHNGPKRMPILFDEKFFKLRPRKSTGSTDNSMLSGSSQSNRTTPEFMAQEHKTRPSQYTNDSLNVTDTSSINDGLLESSDSYGTASTSGDFVQSRSWYRSDYNGNSSTNSHSSRDSENYFSLNSSHSTTSSSTQNRAPPYKRYYSAKELYDKKRHN